MKVDFHHFSLFKFMKSSKFFLSSIPSMLLLCLSFVSFFSFFSFLSLFFFHMFICMTFYWSTDMERWRAVVWVVLVNCMISVICVSFLSFSSQISVAKTSRDRTFLERVSGMICWGSASFAPRLCKIPLLVAEWRDSSIGLDAVQLTHCVISPDEHSVRRWLRKGWGWVALCQSYAKANASVGFQRLPGHI